LTTGDYVQVTGVSGCDSFIAADGSIQTVRRILSPAIVKIGP